MDDIGHKIRLIDQLFRLRMNKNLEELDLTVSQMHVLIYLQKHEGEKVTQKTLSKIFNVKHSTMAGILQRMVDKELIEITVDDQNRKYKNIVKTHKADEIKDKMTKHRHNTERVLLENFTSAETKILAEYLDRIYNNLNNDDYIPNYKKCNLKGDKIKC